MSGRPRNRFLDAFSTASRRPLVLAHRGDSFIAPENTIAAAQFGFDASADGWELDVQLTADGVPIVIHDLTLARTTDVATQFAGDPRGELGYLVADFTLEEIKRLDAGSWFVAAHGPPRSEPIFGTIGQNLAVELGADDSSGRIRIPTLVEALEFTARLDWVVNVELKADFGGDRGLVDAVVSVIEETATADRVLVSSFDHAMVARVGQQCRGVATGVLVTTPLLRPAEYVREVVGADAYHVSTAALGASSAAYARRPSAGALRVEDVVACRRAGVPVLVYTVNDARPDGLAVHLAEAGVAALFSDDPGPIIRRFKLSPS